MILNPYAIVIDAYVTLGGIKPSASAYADHKAYINASGQAAYITALEGIFAGKTNADMATTVLTNLGLTAAFTAAQGEAYFAANAGSRVQAALSLTSALANYSGTDTVLVAAKTTHNQVASNAYAYASVATNTVDSAVSATSSNTGQTFTLTTGTDALSGTNGSDTFNGVLQANGATGTTAQPGDSVNGGEGIDTLSISVAGDIGANAFTISAIQTTGVEKLFLSNFQTRAAVATTVATDLMSGLTTVGLSASSATGDTAFTGLNGIVDAEMRNGAADLTLTYGAAAVVGTADTQKLAVSNLSAGTFKADGIETLAITSDTVKSTLAAVVSDKLKTVTVSGDKDLTITAAVDFVAGTNGDTTIDATIDASTFTGKLSVVASDTNDIEVKGGSGNDTIAMAAALTKTDKIDGGAGDDTLTMTAAGLTTEFAGVSNIETVAFTASTGAVAMDVSKLSAGVTTVEVNHSDSNSNNTTAEVLTISNLDGQSVTIKHTTANAQNGGAGDSSDADGASITITGKTDTADDAVSVKLAAIDTEANEKGLQTLNVANFETVNIESALPTTGTVTNQVTTLTATSAKAVNVTGAADLTLTAVGGGAMTSLNASALAGKFTATLAGDKVAVSLGQKDSTVNFAATLNNDDSVTGGAGKDTLTASANGLTATTGALKIANVETINLTTGGNNTLDLSGVTGTGVTVAVTDNVQTITGFDLAHTISLGLAADESATASEIDVTATDATGSNDTLKVSVENTNGTTSSIIDASSIENLALTVVAAGSATLDLTTFEGNAVTLASKAGVTGTGAVGLGTMHKNINSVTSTYAGAVTANFSNNTAGVTFTGAGTAIQNVTGTAKADTITFGATAGIVHVVSGGAGTDTVNMTAKNGLANVGSIDAENVNIAVTAGDDVTITTSFGTGVDNVTLTGGNSLSTFTTGTLVDEVKTLNSSAFGGNIVATVANDKLDSTVVVTGGASTKDEVNVTLATAATTYALKSTGVETLRVIATAAASTTVSVADATGISEIEVDQGANVATQTVSISGLTGSETITLKASDDNNAGANEHILKAVLTDATGTADTIKFKVGGGTIDADARLATDDIETVTINSDNAATLDLSLLAMTAAADRMKLVVTGDSALTATLTGADITTIDAAGMTTGGSFVQNGRSATDAVTYTGSAGADTFIMSHTADVVNGGAGTNDTLTIAKAAILGGLNVDLSAADEQILSFNGSATSGTVTGFENVDASGYTGSFGAQITAIKTGSNITGTANADQITGGAGADTFVVNAGTVANSDVMDGGAGTDILQVATTLTYTQATDASLTNVETINLIGTASAVLTGQTEAFTINDGAGANSITGGKGNDTIALTAADAAVDTLVFANTAANNGADVITGFNTGDVLNFAAFIAATKDIAGGAIAITSSLGVSIANSLDYGTNVVNVITLADIQTLTAANFAGTASATAIKTAASSKYIVIGDVAADANTTQNIYYVSTDGANAATVTLVGTMNEFTIVTANLTTA